MRGGEQPTDVVVCATLDAPPRGRRRRARTAPAAPEPGPAPLPLTRLTVVSTTDLGGPPEAQGWLREIDAHPGIGEALVDRALRVVNRALRAQAAAARDPYVREVAAGGAVATRIGYGEGEQVADGRWSEARELERAEPRRRRATPEESQERVAAILGGHDELRASETLLLRARLDLDHGDARASALQLRVGIEALLGEVAEQGRGSEEVEDLRARVGELDRLTATGSEGDEDRAAWLSETLGMCERVVRRRRRKSSTSP